MHEHTHTHARQLPLQAKTERLERKTTKREVVLEREERRVGKDAGSQKKKGEKKKRGRKGDMFSNVPSRRRRRVSARASIGKRL